MSDLTLAQSHAEAALSLSLFRHNNLGNPSEFGGTDEGSPSATPSRELDLGRVGDVETGPKRTRELQLFIHDLLQVMLVAGPFIALAPLFHL